MSRVAVVCGRAPSGHASAASSLAKRFVSRGHDAVLVSVAADVNPLIGPFLDGLYLRVLKSCPRLWRGIYDRPSVVRATRPLRTLYWRACGEKVLAKIQEIKPDAVICAHAAPLSILALGKARREISVPLIACPTDYGVHSFWLSGAVDLYLAPSLPAARSLMAGGIEESRIIQTGIPIDPAFGRPMSQSSARAGLGAPENGAIFFLSGGSRGLGRVAQTSAALLKKFPEAFILAACGENKKLWLALTALRNPRVKPFFNANKDLMARLMRASSLFIGKAGGVSAAEFLASGLPTILYGALPGQEERNARYLVGAGAVLQARTLSELLNAADGLLRSPERGTELVSRAKALAAPDSAEKAVLTVEKFLGLRNGRKRLLPA